MNTRIEKTRSITRKKLEPLVIPGIQLLVPTTSVVVFSADGANAFVEVTAIVTLKHEGD